MVADVTQPLDVDLCAVRISQMCVDCSLLAVHVILYHCIIIIEWTHVENWICAQFSVRFCELMMHACPAWTCVITIVLKIYDNFQSGSMCDINMKPPIPFGVIQSLRKCVNTCGSSSGTKMSISTSNGNMCVPSSMIENSVFFFSSWFSSIHHIRASTADLHFWVIKAHFCRFICRKCPVHHLFIR